MATILLTWNPGPGNDEQWSPDTWAVEMAHRTVQEEAHEGSWSVGQRRKGIFPGDQFFLMRQGAHGRGIVARGEVDGEIEFGPGWREGESSAAYIKVIWLEALPLELRLDTTVLAQKIPDYGWDTVFGSGRDISHVAGGLEKLWKQQVKRAGLRLLTRDDLVEENTIDWGQVSPADVPDLLGFLTDDEVRALLIEEFDYLEEDLAELDTRQKLDDELVLLADELQQDYTEQGNPDDVEEALGGAGFGSVEQNRKVEQAAVEMVTRALESEGFAVVSVEALNKGWDLEAGKGDEVRLVEVKGVSGAEPRFFLTANERRAALHEADWELWVVTNALSVPTILEFDRDQVVDAALPTLYRVDLSEG